MPRARKTEDGQPVERVDPPDAQPDVADQAPDVQPANENVSEEVQVILPAADDAVRRGGYVLTANGWELEDPQSTQDDETAEPAEDEE